MMRRPQIIVLMLCATLAIAQQNQLRNGTASGQSSIGTIGNAIVLVSLGVSPSNPAIPIGNFQSFTALGTYSNSSTADLTSVSTWLSSNTSIATNGGSGPTFQCIHNGIVTIMAIYQGIQGNALLTCQSVTFTPQGAITTIQSGSSQTITQFTAANGTPPYGFSSTDLPGFLSLTSTGCGANQVACSLVGAPATLGVFNFHIQATDNIGNQACTPPGCAVSLNVVAASTEDNKYCSSSGSPSYTETVTGLTDEAQSIIGIQMLQQCNNTAIANTPTGGGQVIEVCPPGELSNGVPIPGCAALPAPPLSPHNPSVNCHVTSGVLYCETIQDALDSIATSGTPCGNTIQLFGTIDDANPLTAQNVYTENVQPIQNILCGQDHTQPWNWLENSQFAKLPPPGNRITPAWVNQTSVTGRPNYAQTTDFGVPSGTYLPMWRCRQLTAGGCPGLDTGAGGTTPAIIDGLRIMGIFVGSPHARNSQLDVYGNHICPSNGSSTSLQWQCSPGYVGQNFSAGCDPQGSGANAINCDNSTSGFYGSRHIIFDRDIFLGCDNPAVTSTPPAANDCYDTAETALLMQGGRHLSVVDSYLYQITCLYGIGGCVDSHAIAGGNPPSLFPTTGNDGPFKIEDNYIEATGENFFIGGGGAALNVIPTDYEIRSNDAFKPLTWLAVPLAGTNNVQFPGVIYDAYIPNARYGTGYHAGTSCSVDPPLVGTQAQCTPELASDGLGNFEIVNVLVCPLAPCSNSTPAGSGYGVQDKANGNTAISNPNFYFTDAGTTYTSCGSQLQGNVSSQIVAGQQEITWNHGNKFISGLTGAPSLLGICPGINACSFSGATAYTVTSFINNKTLVIGTTLGTQLTNNAYITNLPSRGDCVKPLIGLFNVKNPGEYKNAVRVLHEGNVTTNNFNGQSDQSGGAFLITPKNANDAEPSAQVTDVVERYNLYRNTVQGITIGAAAATRGGTLALAIARVSVHDIIIDGMNAYYWSSGSSPVVSGGGLCVNVSNANPPATAVGTIYINHVGCVGSLPRGQSQSGGAALALNNGSFLAHAVMPAVMQNVTFINSIAAGGIRNVSQQSNGLAGCNSNSCSVTHGATTYGPSETAERQALASDWLDPVSGSNYTGNVVMQLGLSNGTANTDNAGNMTSASGLTFPGPYSATPVTCPGGYPTLSPMICTPVYIEGFGFSTITAVSSSTAAVISPAAGSLTGSKWAGGGLPGIPGTCNPSACAISPPGGGGATAQCTPTTSGGAVTKLNLKDPGSGYITIPSVSFSGGTCSGGGAPQAVALIGGAGNGKTSSACIDHDVLPTAAWAGELSMGPPFPAHQIDAVNNTCQFPAGGHINTNITGTPITVDTWAKVGFVGFDGATTGIDQNGAECNGLNPPAGSTPTITPCQPPDLHLLLTSPFHLAASDGLDIGPNVDLVLGTASGTPSQYTQCFTTAGHYVCPR